MADKLDIITNPTGETLTTILNTGETSLNLEGGTGGEQESGGEPSHDAYADNPVNNPTTTMTTETPTITQIGPKMDIKYYYLQKSGDTITKIELTSGEIEVKKTNLADYKESFRAAVTPWSGFSFFHSPPNFLFSSCCLRFILLSLRFSGMAQINFLCS